MKSINAMELDRELAKGPALLVDVRTPAEFESAHAEPAVNVPLDRITGDAINGLRNSQDMTVYLICQSGTRSKTACQKLADLDNVVTVEGGTQAWIDAGIPVIEGRETISLERQVRIAAGSLVVIGTALGVFVSPWFLGLSAFVGAGLVFAGVTDTCGMAMLLGKMPWNQGASCPATKEFHS